MGSLKISFGKHKLDGRYYDAGSVPNGLKCNCICNECGSDLEAVHPDRSGRVKHFRHHTLQDCKGGLESLFHKVAKQILKENNTIQVSPKEEYIYSSCDVEIPRHGCQPDAFLSNDHSSLIVEIFFWHQIDDATLKTYLNKEERVLEIDISSERKTLFDYQRLKKLILSGAPRQLYTNDDPMPESNKRTSLPGWILAAVLLLVSCILFRKYGRKYRRRRRR